MKRQIKFRAWDTKRLEMIDGIEIRFRGPDQLPDNDVADYLCDDRYALLPFTGVKDKNGKETYEGDVVDCDFGRGFIEWSDHEGETGCCFQIKLVGERGGWTSLSQDRRGGHSVIGNIYENPNLLK